MKDTNKLYFSNGTDKPIIINCDLKEKAPKPIFVSEYKRREGYSSFWGLVKMLIRINKNNLKYKTKVKYDIILPIKWV